MTQIPHFEKTLIFRERSGFLEGGSVPTSPCDGEKRIFLLSPARLDGIRAQRLLREESKSELAARLRREGIPIGELFSFLSSLYFRGKLAYARVFSNSPGALPGVLVVAPSRGLLGPDVVLSLGELQEMAVTRVDLEDENYLGPFKRDLKSLFGQLDSKTRVVLLGSIATEKYVTPLLEVFGERLMFPSAFVGRGDMSRGGLMLQCSREMHELHYAPVATTIRSIARNKRKIKTSGG